MRIWNSVNAAGRLAVLALSSTLAAGCLGEEGELGEIEEELVGNGFFVWGWGTTRDQTGINIGPASSQACVLSGVQGNLSKGTSSPGVRSQAFVSRNTATDEVFLIAHGGASFDQAANALVWDDNPVAAGATCFLAPVSLTSTVSSTKNSPIFSHFFSPIVSGRECFLTQVQGYDNGWDSSSRFARVKRYTTTDPTHLQTGWYLEHNIPGNPNGSSTRISASCVDFTTLRATGTYSAGINQQITFGSGVKACGLAGIQGAFNVNSWDDGVRIRPPSTFTGEWFIDVSSGKSATATCVY